MATGRVIQNRIKATKNIRQITKAMEAVSAVKMRKSEAAAISARPYALSALKVLKNIRAHVSAREIAASPFFQKRKTGKTCLLVITSDKGLAGSLNSKVISAAEKFIGGADKKDTADIVAVGRRGVNYFKRRGYNVPAEFIGNGDITSIEKTVPISEFIKDSYLSGNYNKVIIFYTNFLSALKQQVIQRELIPVEVKTIEEIIKNIIPESGRYSGLPEAFKETDKKTQAQYLFEPSVEAVLAEIIPILLNVEIYSCILESNAAEHSSRMVAMRSASDNAKELIGSLSISYNKARQATITKEITEITAGAEALTV